MPIATFLRDPRRPLFLLGLASAGVLAAALVFQYGFGYQPCILCLWQRGPYGAVIVFALLAVLFGRMRGVADALLVASGLALLGGAGIAAYHVGVEQHWWAGTASCGGAGGAATLEDLRAMVMAAPVVQCDQIQWQMFGVSMAGYNVLVSLVMAVFALAAARVGYRGRPSAIG